ncbi:MAG: nucleotide exchange factor GrpE [Bacteroidales bacterium]
MNNAIEDLKALQISNLNTIKELNNQVRKLESEKSIQSISNFNSIKELNDQIRQLESERAIQHAADLNSIKALNEQAKILESEKNNQNISNLNTIQELNKQVTQLESEKIIQFNSDFNSIKELNKNIELLESEKHIQLLQLAMGLISVVDSFEEFKKAIPKKIFNKSNKGKNALIQFKKARKSLKGILKEFKISKITFPENQLIDGYGMVVGTEPNINEPENAILSVVKNGYICKSQVIREAEVIVVKNYISPNG